MNAPLAEPATASRRGDVFAILAARWKDVAVAFAVVVAIAIAYLNLAEKQYTASALLAPSDAELNMLTGVSTMTDISSLSLGKIGLGFGLGSQDPQFAALLLQLTSNTTARTLLDDDRVKAALFDKIWDARSRTFHPPQGFFAGIVAAAKFVLGMSPWHAPAAADMQRYLDQHVVAREIGISGLYSVTYAHKDPAFAQYFLARVLSVSDDYLKQEKLARARAYIRYLDLRLKDIADVDQKQAMLKLRLKQENFLMAGSVNLPFSADINDPPVTPSRPTWPNPVIVAVITLFFGGGLAAAAGAYFRPYEAVRRRVLAWRRPRAHAFAPGRSSVP